MFVVRFARRLRQSLGPLWWYSALLFAVSRLGDVVNLYIGAFLVPDLVPTADLGAVRPLMRVAELVAMPLVFLVLPAEKFLNVFAERRETGKARALVRDLLLLTAALLAALALAGGIANGPLLERLHLSGPAHAGILPLLLLLTAGACLRPIAQAAARSFKLFNSVVLAGLPDPFVRLVLMLVLLRAMSPLRGFVVAQGLSGLAGTAVLMAAVALFFRRERVRCESYRAHLREMADYAAPLLLYTLATTFQDPVEDFLIRQRLTEDASAAAYILKTLAMIPQYFGGAVAMFLFPLVSSAYEQRRETRRYLWQSMCVTGLLGLGCCALLTAWGDFAISLRPAWSVACDFPGLIGWLSLGIAFRVVVNCFVLHEHACRRFRYLRFFLPMQFLQTGGLFILMGWGAFRNILPSPLWELVAAWPRETLRFVILWGAAWQGATLAAVVAFAAAEQKALQHTPQKHTNP